MIAHADPDSPSLIRVHCCISGFTQDERRLHGVFRLSERLHELRFNNRVSRVMLRRWNDDWDTVAENIWLISQYHRAEVLVNIYAYSWGAGWGFVRLAEALRKREVRVFFAVLSDPVYRNPHFVLRWTSLLGRDYPWSPKIRVPANVTHVKSFYQRQNRPQGHQLVTDEDFSGVVFPPRELQRTHQYMDDAPQFHEACIEAADKLQAVRW